MGRRPRFSSFGRILTCRSIGRHNPQTFAVRLESHRSGIPRYQDLMFRHGRNKPRHDRGRRVAEGVAGPDLNDGEHWCDGLQEFSGR